MVVDLFKFIYLSSYDKFLYIFPKESEIRERLRKDYNALVRDLFSRCFSMKNRFEEFRLVFSIRSQWGFLADRLWKVCFRGVLKYSMTVLIQ